MDVQKAFLARVLYSNGVPVACCGQLSGRFEDGLMGGNLVVEVSVHIWESAIPDADNGNLIDLL
jgi:hypothetical protein